MGKKRIKVIGAKSPQKEPKKRQLVKTGLPVETSRRLVKSGKEHGRITDMGAKAPEEAKRIKEKEKELAKLEKEAAKKLQPQKRPSRVRLDGAGKKSKVAKRKRGKKYLAAWKKVDRQKFYSLTKAIKLLKETSISKFNGSVEVHLNLKESGLKGEVAFPHSTGKTQRIKIADESLIKELDKGKIDFDVLIATPAMMPKLVKYARLLGPKGLMPNPKAGTICEKPEKLAKKMAGKVQFRAESKAPLIHLVIGKVDAKEKELAENFQALINAAGQRNIFKAVLTSTMGPGIKVDLSNCSHLLTR